MSKESARNLLQGYIYDKLCASFGVDDRPAPGFYVNGQISLPRLVTYKTVGQIMAEFGMAMKHEVKETVFLKDPNFPHECPNCKGAAYIGFSSFECKARCK